jgi:membrane-bound lytic murein transglycosylase A
MINRGFKRLIALLIVAWLSAACTTTPEHRPSAPAIHAEEKEPLLRLGPPIKIKNSSSVLIYPTEFADLAGWNVDNHALAFKAFRHSCESWRSQPDDKPLGGIFKLGRIGDWKRLCAKPVKNGEEKQFFESWFRPYAIADNGNFDGLFTGYFLPELHGALHQSNRYHTPLYGIPDDLINRSGQIGRFENDQFLPYFTRTEIAAGTLAGQNAELVWVDNAIDAYFAEIQGSARIVFEDGHIQGLSYACKNGHPYYAVGKTLVDNGSIQKEQVSMQTIRAWIDTHPEQGRQLMLQNPSVVFFRLTDVKPGLGPLGSMQAPLTAGYSLAVDSHLLPLGIPLWLDAEHPNGKQRLRRLVIAQDTGSAIKGLLRGDVFWGQGRDAGEIAGVMKSKGRYFILAPKHLAPD